TTMHGFTGESARVRLYDKLDRVTIPRCDAVAAVSGKLYEQARSFGVDETKLALIPNGVEVRRYACDTTLEAAKLSLGTSRDRPLIVVLGRLSPEKGQDRAIDMLQGLHDAGVDAQLVLVGDGPTRSELEGQAQHAGLTDHVTFAGWLPDPRPYLQAADLLLLPSRTEGLPNAVLEAMASGLTVAAAPVGAVPEALDYGRAGCLLDEDTHTWARKLAGLLSSPGRLSRLAQAGHERTKRFYGFDLRMRRMIALYDRALGLAADQTPISFETDQASPEIGEVQTLRQAA
ncbi:MAG: glycosyltransferase family 4 protein, partial [Planctomycetota bacterium]